MAASGGFIKGYVLGEVVGTPFIAQPKKNDPGGPPAFASAKIIVRRFANGRPRHLWIRLVFNGRRAVTIQRWCDSGTRIFAEGRLEQKKWTGNDGIKRLDYDLIVDDFQFVDRTEFNRQATDEATEASRDTRPIAQPTRYRGAFK